MAHVLALDQGTTSSRAIVYDEAGRAVATAQRELQQHFPQPGWVEHDAMQIARDQEAVAEEALAEAGVGEGDLAAIGITNQRETTVVWDRATGEPIHRAIVWQDRRTAPAMRRWRDAGLEADTRERTGLVLDPYFSASKIAWLLDHVPQARARAEAGELAFGTIDAWLLWRLTDGRVHATDASNASRTLLYDLHEGGWSDELCERFGVPRALLPDIVPSSGVVAEARRPGPLAGVPVAGIAGDQQAALFGQACFEPGLAKNTYGTGCFLLLNVGLEPVVDERRLLGTVAWRRDERTLHAVEGSVFIGGALVQWLRDGLGIIEEAADVEGLARQVEDSGGVVLVPAFAGLGAPHWDAEARGTIVGLTRGTTRAHLARAALEGIAHQVADVLEAMGEAAGRTIGELRVDGGAAANDTLLQVQADLLQRPIARSAVQETTALGAAWLAGLGVGLWAEEAELAARWREDARFEPHVDADRAAAARATWARALDRARGWAAEGP